MIIAKIVQNGQIITLKDVVPTFQYSANLQMQFIRDEQYKDCVLTGWYKHLKGEEYLLDIKEDGTFTLGKDIFSKEGSVYFSFALNRTDGEIIHLGFVDFEVKQSFGNDSAILPEEQETWINVVSSAAREAIKEDVELVKEKAIESSNSAKSALESANIAQSSANAALESEEKALEYTASAERFKNSASNFANLANASKTEAQQSATSASNSASNALGSSNKAKEHLDSVIEKTNTFNSDYNNKVNSFNEDYTSKVNSFNSNVEDANIALNTKISTANTNIDKKVLDANNVLDRKIADTNTNLDAKVNVATEQANIAKQEADRAELVGDAKLDKNQGSENAGKAMVVDTDGNVVPGNALQSNVYTQEEVDYMLRDKMDKPYVDIVISDDTAIDSTMDGNLKINSIMGNTIQKESPTPENPSEIMGVTELNIKIVGKNLFNWEYASNLDNWTRVDGGYAVLPIRVPSNVTLTTSGNRILDGWGYYAFISWDATNGLANSYGWLYHNNQGSNFNTFTRKTDSIIYIYVTYSKVTNFLSDFKNLQIEVGEIPTEYAGYTENSILYVLKKPLLGTKKYTDVITSINRVNKMAIYTFTGKEVWHGDNINTSGYYGRYIELPNASTGSGNQVFCTILKFVAGAISVAGEGCCQSSNMFNLKFSNSRLGIEQGTPIEQKRTAFNNYIKYLLDTGMTIQCSYVLENPVTESLEPELLEILRQLKTFNPCTNIIVDGVVKPIINAQYPKDLALAQQKLETKLLNLQTEVLKNV